MEIEIPYSKKALTDILLGPETRVKMNEIADNMLMLYKAQVTKRTGQLAASAHAHVHKDSKRKDRWIAELVVGGRGTPAFDYAAPHEFGRGVPGTARAVVTHPADDLNAVLAQIGSY